MVHWEKWHNLTEQGKENFLWHFLKVISYYIKKVWHHFIGTSKSDNFFLKPQSLVQERSLLFSLQESESDRLHLSEDTDSLYVPLLFLFPRE